MKYVRTKDGTIWKENELSTNSRDLWEGLFIKNNSIYEKIRHWEHNDKYRIEYKKISNIVKQADTIEELCDEFVAVDGNDNEHFIGKGFNFLKSCVNNNKDKIYGAIWTDKGLIYVAKMNENGELELL